MPKFSLQLALIVSSFALNPVLGASPAVAPAVPPTVPPPAATAAAAVDDGMGELKETPQKSLFDDPTAVGGAHLHVQFNHPDSKALDTFALHPYPVKLPMFKGFGKLPVKEKELAYTCFAMGYSARQSQDKPYQPGGWRMYYAFNEAFRKSGLALPHTAITAYRFRDDLLPYMVAECKRWNAFEAARMAHYKQMLEDYDRNKVEAENEAARAGLFPIALREHKGLTVDKDIPPGNWWLTCTRRRPGLVMYWQLPFSAAEGEKVNILLSHANATVITGGW